MHVTDASPGACFCVFKQRIVQSNSKFYCSFSARLPAHNIGSSMGRTLQGFKAAAVSAKPREAKQLLEAQLRADLITSKSKQPLSANFLCSPDTLQESEVAGNSRNRAC